MFSNTLGYNTEIIARFVHGGKDGTSWQNGNILEIRKTDVDTWLFVTWEQRGDEEINKNAITLHGEQLRAMFEHKYLFTKG